MNIRFMHKRKESVSKMFYSYGYTCGTYGKVCLADVCPQKCND